MQPAEVEAALARNFKRNTAKQTETKKIKSQIFRASTGGFHAASESKLQNCKKVEAVDCKVNSTVCNGVQNALANAGVHQVGISNTSVSVNASVDHNNVPTLQNREQTCLLYDTRLNGLQDKFINSILHDTGCKRSFTPQDSRIYKMWQQHSDFAFGFIPYTEQVMPDVVTNVSPVGLSVFDIHALVRATGEHNYMCARIPVESQLKVSAWKELLSDYWDQQLLQLIEYGFPLDFNRQCPLKCEGENHTSATEHPADIEAYIQEECQFNAILGPFPENPIKGGHSSPFMTRHKPNSNCRRVIIDLSWPLGASVNAGMDKDT